MIVPWYISFIKTLFMNICIVYATCKIENKQSDTLKQKNILILIIIVMTILYSFYRNYINIDILSPIYYLLFMIIISISINIKFKYGFTLSSFAILISYISLIIAICINYIILKIININIKEYNILEYVCIGFIQFGLIYLFFKIKRFKYGFSFLKHNDKYKILNIVCAVTIIICIVFCFSKNDYIGTLIFTTIVLGTFLIINWIKKSITNYYKKQLKDKTVETLNEKIKEQDLLINSLNIELANVLKINHKYNHRLAAMEQVVSKLALNEETSKEYGDITDTLEKLSKEYKEELYNINKIKELPKTNIFSIDKILEYMNIEAERENIKFDLEICSNVKELTDKIIPKNKIETLIGDHIKDAIIAVKCSDNKYKNIKLVFDFEDNCYVIKFFDTGIEFDIATLLKLGIEPVTTHKLSGGSGIGFMTTFETLKEYKASLIIEEIGELSTEKYTKAIIIKFDNKNKYIIKSYRAEKILEILESDRIIVEKL